MKRVFSLCVVIVFALTAFAMMGITYVKVSDPACNKCSITNGGATRKCGICGGFLNGGKTTLVDGDWLQATFTCKKCKHQSTWKYKNQ